VAESWKKEHLPKVGEERTKAILSRLNMMTPLYNLIFSEIKLIDLQTFFNNLVVSSGTKKEYRSVINLIFEYGIKYELIQKNPMSHVDLGKHQNVRKSNTFSYEEIQIL